MKRIISLFIISAIVLSLTLITASAAIRYPHHMYGDVDGDEDVTIVDATHIQRFDTKIADFDNIQKEAADYDRDGNISIIDATFIQRKATLIGVPDYCGGIFTEENRITNFYASYSPDKAMTGVPVTFTAEAVSGTQITGYRLCITDADTHETVFDERSTNNQFTFTFDDPGYYHITVQSFDKLNVTVYSSSSYDIYMTVTEPYSLDKPVINNYYFNSLYQQSKITVSAIGGSAPYKYCISVDDTDYNYSSGYVNENTFDLPNVPVRFGYDLIITAMDSNGNISEPCIVYIDYSAIEG